MSSLRQTYVAVVDDDESLCRSLGRLLRAAGIQPVTYLSAEAFLADTKRPRFDCLVFDIQLGGMSGIELHCQLNSSGSTTPVIYITAHDEPATREEAQAAGCAAYFRKTAPGEAVLQAIRRAVGLEDSDSDRRPLEKNQPS
jgi:FixJ family two-component response regulator